MPASAKLGSDYSFLPLTQCQAWLCPLICFFLFFFLTELWAQSWFSALCYYYSKVFHISTILGFRVLGVSFVFFNGFLTIKIAILLFIQLLGAVAQRGEIWASALILFALEISQCFPSLSLMWGLRIISKEIFGMRMCLDNFHSGNNKRL